MGYKQMNFPKILNGSDGSDGNTIGIAIVGTVDSSSAQFTYTSSNGIGKYASRVEAIAAARKAGFSGDLLAEGLVAAAQPYQTQDIIYFQTGPSDIKVTHKATVIKNQYLDLDGGVVIPTQMDFIEVTGSGTILATADSNPIDGFNKLKNAQVAKTPVVIIAGDANIILPIRAIITDLSLTIKVSDNSAAFDFTFIETKISSAKTTGFESSMYPKKPNVAVPKSQAKVTAAKHASAKAARSGATDPAKVADQSENVFKDVVGIPPQKVQTQNADDGVGSWLMKYIAAPVIHFLTSPHDIGISKSRTQ